MLSIQAKYKQLSIEFFECIINWQWLHSFPARNGKFLCKTGYESLPG